MENLDLNILNPAYWVMILITGKTILWTFLLMFTGIFDN